MRRKVFSVITAIVMMLTLTPRIDLPALAAPGDVITFPDQNFEIAVREVINKPTGAITKGDVEGVTELYVSGKGIADLTGIEYFTALEGLGCAANKLTEIDVSKNTALYTLSCDQNQLTKLDVSKNIALGSLYCGFNQLAKLDLVKNTVLSSLFCNNNQLTQLDVSKNTALTQLHCYSNQLTTLDVSKNMALETLSCSVNQLTALDVSKNTALIQLNCNSNQLTTLDVSENTVLESLSCSENQLTVLDVSKNTILASFSCFGNQLKTLNLNENVLLTELDCGKNQLTTLDVSRNVELRHLVCIDSQLTTLDVSKNILLTWLGCNDNRLTALDLSNNTALIYLYCDNNQLTILDVSKNTALISLWCKNNQLTTLDLSGSTILEGSCANNYFPSRSAIIGIDKSKLEDFEFDPQKTFAPNIDAASAWAQGHVNDAYNKGFLPDELQNGYQAAITRGEFVRLAMSWLRYYTGLNGDELMSKNEVTRGEFSDTDDPVILAAAALGITAGVGDGKFGVDDLFRREQAAVMLTHVFDILGQDTAKPSSAGFVDIGSASDWAVDPINFVGKKEIMAGVGEGKFDPMSTFSREQSIIVFNKIIK